jgi:hypothetical protein
MWLDDYYLDLFELQFGAKKGGLRIARLFQIEDC